MLGWIMLRFGEAWQCTLLDEIPLLPGLGWCCGSKLFIWNLHQSRQPFPSNTVDEKHVSIGHQSGSWVPMDDSGELGIGWRCE